MCAIKKKQQKNSNQCMLWTGPSFCLWIYCILKYMKLRNSRIRHIRSTLQLTSFTPHFLQWKGYSCAEMRQCGHELNKSLKYSFRLYGENEQLFFVTWSTCITTGQESTKPVFTTSENWEKKVTFCHERNKLWNLLFAWFVLTMSSVLFWITVCLW